MLSGGGAQHDAVSALVDLPADELRQRAPVDRLARERRDQRREHAVKPMVHGRPHSKRSGPALKRTARGLRPVSDSA